MSEGGDFDDDDGEDVEPFVPKSATDKDKDRPGAAFERLVAALQKKVGPDSNVKWNERVRGCQIDVTVRAQVGAHPLLVIIECRDYAKKLGIKHVRELVSVKEEAAADLVVLVTRTGFSGPALRRAAEKQIQTCILRPATDDDSPGPVKRRPEILIEYDYAGVEILKLAVETTTGERFFVSPNAQIEGPAGRTFIDRIIRAWALEDPSRHGPQMLEFDSPVRLLRDDESPIIARIYCELRWFAQIVGFDLWRAPEEWVFVRHTPTGIASEPQFFQFEELRALADTFRR